MELDKQPSNGWDKNKLVLTGAVLLAAVLICGSLILTRGPDFLKAILNPSFNIPNSSTNPTPSPQTSKIVSLSGEGVATLGQNDAPITIVEFSDFQCPFCRNFWQDTLPSIKKDYIDTGKARIVYRNFPLSFHPGAKPAAEAADCAGEQGKFWGMHDKIFAEQTKLGQGTVNFTSDDLKKWATAIGLDKTKFNACLDSEKYASEVEKDLAEGTADGVSGTPSFFVAAKLPLKLDVDYLNQRLAAGEMVIYFDNGAFIEGAQPSSVFKGVIDKLLAGK